MEDVRSRGGMLPKAAVKRRVVLISLREARKKKSPSFSVIRMGYVLMYKEQCCKVAGESSVHLQLCYLPCTRATGPVMCTSRVHV